MTEQEKREHFAFLNGVAADMKESRKEIIDLLEGIKAEIENHCCFTIGTENDPAITLHDVFEIIDRAIGEFEV